MEWKELVALPQEELTKVRYDDRRLDSFANEVERRYDLPNDLIVAIKNAGERSNTEQVSRSGAKGVMQFMDSTRKLYDHDPKDPLASIDAAGRFFKDLLKQYDGDVKAAVAHYNGGTRAGKAVLKGMEPPSEETRNYWKRMQDYMEQRPLPPPMVVPTVVAAVPKNESVDAAPMVAVAPRQERVLKYDAGGKRMPSLAEK
jgi:soluble lytic murein transglycosylase-like protein